MGKRKPDPGFKLCNVCEPPGSGKMNLYGYGVPHKEGFGRRVKCTACDGVGQTPCEEKEPKPRGRKRGTGRTYDRKPGERGPGEQVERSENQGYLWTPEELKILDEGFETLTKKELMDKLPGRGWRAIRTKGRLQEMTRKHFGGPGKKTRTKPWSSLEEKIISSNWRYCTPRQLENMLPGRTVDEIKAKALQMGLIKKWSL